MTPPTRYDIERLLFSDPAADEWREEARATLARDADLLGALGAVYELVDQVQSDVSDVVVALEAARREATPSLPELTEAEELQRLATAAERAAMMLLHAAWVAKVEAGRLNRARINECSVRADGGPCR
jgi:hypothetical protein